MYEFPSYPSPIRSDKRDAAGILAGGPECVVTEKIDGSQFKIHKDPQGTVWFGSKSRTIPHDQTGSFSNGTDTLRELEWTRGWVYFGEYLAKPKQNKLAYDNTPPHNFILFDVVNSTGQYLRRAEVLAEALRLGLMAVPALHIAPVTLYSLDSDSSMVKAWLNTQSCLGGQTVEGVVVKVYHDDGRLEQIKVVRQDFQEVGKKAVATGDVVARVVAIGEKYKSTARWDKAIQAVRESGQLTGTKKDIGTCFRELNRDLLDDCQPQWEMELSSNLCDFTFEEIGVDPVRFTEANMTIGKALMMKFGKAIMKRASGGFASYVEDELGL